MIPFDKLEILNPKRESEIQTGRASWYPYYAGFSEKFAHKLILSAKMQIESQVSDPWNGSGTTTAAAAGIGHNAFGCDLNPVMVLAARARMLSKREKKSLVPLGAIILKHAAKADHVEEDPLANWFQTGAAGNLRSIERSIQQVLVNENQRYNICTAEHVQHVSDLAAFFYVALFRTTRSLLSRYDATNPTWIKSPVKANSKLRTSLQELHSVFRIHVSEMAQAIDGDNLTKDSEVKISVGSSASVPLPDKSVDMVLSSPPYCTRIDYAVATKAELAVLGYRIDIEFDDLRRQLIGTSTVPRVAPISNIAWGRTCTEFLGEVESHRSKASSGYYLKNHLQYFDSIYTSLGEISRTLKKEAACILVVQDSFYKDVHNDLPKIIVEMSESQNMALRRQVPFLHQRTMAGVNPGVRKYRAEVSATESVLCFSKN